MIDASNKDPITGLLSESSFLVLGDELIKKQPRLSIVRIDIEHFSLFEDWFGVPAAQKLLRDIGNYLNNNEKCLLSGYFGRDDIATIMEDDMKDVEELYFAIRDIILKASSSYGFLPAIGVHRGDLTKNLLVGMGRSLLACDVAKKHLTNRISVYDKDLEENFEKETELLRDFKKALDNDEITFYLQPQVRISTGKIVGVESLARWIKKDGTIISPAVFVPILEKHGFIIDLDKYLWEKNVISLKEWLDMGHKAVPVSINVSRMDMYSIDIPEYFENLCKKYDIPHSLIKIEITESAYTESLEFISSLIQRLKASGFSVLMDDFGSGYSSLNMFTNISVDAIKLDALFLKFDDTANDKAIRVLESIVNMAKVISMPIIVEGVETKKQADFLHDLGCRYAQGFYFYKPMPISEFRKLMLNEEIIDRRGFMPKLNEQFRLREFLDQNVYSDNMLNNIIGAVAFYELHDDNTVDIVRYNEQFYKSVNVPDFMDRLVDIGQFLPDVDKPKMLQYLHEAMENRLNGAEGFLRFYKTDGTLSSYLIHYYYLGVYEGFHRFYGSAQNITELQDYKDKLHLVSSFSDESIIFISRVENKWSYNVVAHGLSVVVGLTAKELEEKMNDGTFISRVVRPQDLVMLMHNVVADVEQDRDFVRYIDMYDRDDNPVTIELNFYNVRKLANNVMYVLKTKVKE